MPILELQILFVQSLLGTGILELLGWDVVRMLARVKDWQRQRSSFQDGGLICLLVGASTPHHMVHCCAVFGSSSLWLVAVSRTGIQGKSKKRP